MVARVPRCYPGMTLEEIAEVRPRLVDFTAEMLGGLARKDQRAAGELYVRVSLPETSFSLVKRRAGTRG